MVKTGLSFNSSDGLSHCKLQVLYDPSASPWLGTQWTLNVFIGVVLYPSNILILTGSDHKA